MKLSVLSFKLALLGILGFSLIHCSNSDFGGAVSQSKGSNNKSDEDDDSNGGVEFDYDGESDQDDPNPLNEFIDGGEKIRIGDDGSVLERFNIKETNSLADVAIIIDTSTSMDNEIRHVENNLIKFMEDMAKDEKTEKMQLFVLAGKKKHLLQPPAAVAANKNVTFDNSGHIVDSHNAMAIAQQFLSKTLVLPKLTLRPKAAKHLIFITDDQAEGVKEPDLKSFFQSDYADNPPTVHAIVCLKGGGDECRGVGQGYMNLANDPEYKGTVQDLQTANWGPLFNNIAESIQNSLDYRFELSENLDKDEKVAVYVEGKQLDDSDFSIEDGVLEIDTKALEGQDEVVILYFQG
jgi:hypothetical protein